MQFPGLAGVLPGFGRHGAERLGARLRAARRQVAALDGRAQLAAHLRPLRRAAGTFLWVDPDARLACGVLTDREFGDWAKDAWPRFNDAVLDAVLN